MVLWIASSFPKQSLPLWGPSYDSLNAIGVATFGLAVTTSVFFSETAVPFTFSTHHFSESCCGPQESPLYVLRHLRPSSLGLQNLAVVPAILKMRNSVISLGPSISSTFFKNECNYKLSGSLPFSSWSVIIEISPNTFVIICIFGVCISRCRRLIFIILHISKVIFIFWYVH